MAIIALLVSNNAGAFAQATVSPEAKVAYGMRSFRDQVYAPERKGLNTLDIYSPKSGSNHPVVMFFHGGKFSFGDKRSSVFHKPQAFTSRGIVLVSVDYRLSPAVKFPVHVQDAATAIAWVHKNIGRYGGDPGQLFLMGHSAGAQIAGLVSTDSKYLTERGLGLPSLRGTILLDGGTYNLSATAKSSKRHDLLNSVFGRDPRVWWEASPIKHVAADRHIPPFLVVYIPNRVDAKAQALAFHNALRSAGIQSTMVAIHGKTHAQLNEDLGLPSEQSTTAVLNFLNRNRKSVS